MRVSQFVYNETVEPVEQVSDANRVQFDLDLEPVGQAPDIVVEQHVPENERYQNDLDMVDPE